jgi:predicted RNA binding protein YcfA (HicA-like mRNA interferase family)
MSAADLIKLLKAYGWVRQSGSHKIFQHDTSPGIVAVPTHGKKDIKPGTLNSILKQAGLK